MNLSKFLSIKIIILMGVFLLLSGVLFYSEYSFEKQTGADMDVTLRYRISVDGQPVKDLPLLPLYRFPIILATLLVIGFIAGKKKPTRDYSGNTEQTQNQCTELT